MAESNRRSFLHTTAAGVTGTALLASQRESRAAQTDSLVVGQIGCGGQGNAHLRSWSGQPNVRVAYICDPDANRLKSATQAAPKAKAVADPRRILDDKSVDAVSIATPDHWHATAALLAVDAGKHVYVEKPCSHNVREGRLLLDAARRKNVIVQHGTQSRSSQGIQEALRMLQDGIIGEVLIAKAWNWQRRRAIGRERPSDPPPELDYDMWVGPAEMAPYQSNRLHYNWHWWYNFGCGGMGNDGIHDLDYALWGLGVTQHPSLVSAIGGKYFFDDDQQFPDTQQVAFEFPGQGKVGERKMLIYEQRLWSTNYPYQVDSGVEFFGGKGKMFLSKRGKIEILGDRNARVDRALEKAIPASVGAHQANFLACIRSGQRPAADIEIAHRTATVVHLGNIAARLGRSLRFDPQQERVLQDEQAQAMLGRKYREGGHWAIPRQA